MIETPLIAIVDDDEMALQATSALIEASGLAVRTFTSAEALLSSECLPQISCLVSDVQMPRMNGLELQHKLNTSSHRFPVIFITAFPDRKIRKSVLNAGAVGFLAKPFDPKVLLDSIRSAIREST